MLFNKLIGYNTNEKYANPIVNNAKKPIANGIKLTPSARAVAEILKNDPEYQSWVKGADARRLLRLDALSYHNWLIHTFWEIKNLKKVGVPEPRNGDPNKRTRWEQYNDSLKRPKILQLKTVDEVKQKLNDTFKVKQAERLNKKLLSKDEFMRMASGPGEIEL